MKWQVALKHDQRTRSAEIDLYDVIGDPYMGTTAYSVLYQLRGLDVDTLVGRINTVGGSVSDGMDIRNLVKEHPARTKIARISGCCASIGTVIALGFDVVEMHENSQWMVHESRAAFDFMSAPMLSSDLARMAEVLEKTNQQMLAIYALKTGKSLEELAAVCKAETWFTAAEAKEFGFVDRVIGLADESSMLVSAKAWDAQVIGKLHSFPAPLLAVARAAQKPVAQAEPPAPAVTEPAPEDNMDPKLFAKKAAELSSLFTEMQAFATKVTTLAGSASTEAKSKDLESLSEECKEMSKRAKKAEEELASMSESAAEYEDAKNRAEQAEAATEDLKKKLAKLKGEEEEGDEEEDPDEDPEARALLKQASRKDLRSIARAAIAATGVAKTVGALEGAVMALSAGIGRGASALDLRKAAVDKMIKAGQLTPAQRGWAIRTSQDSLDEYVKALGGKRVGPVGENHEPDPQAAAQRASLTPAGEVTLTAEEKQICKFSGIPEARALEDKKKLLQASAPS